MAGALRQISDLPRSRNLTGVGQAATASSGKLDLSNWLAGVNWEEIQQDLPWNQPKPKARPEARVEEAARIQHGPQPKVRGSLSESKEGREVHAEASPAEDEEAGLLGKGPKVAAVAPAKAGEEGKGSGGQPPPKAEAEKGEAAAQALAWRAPELPKVDGAAVPMSFAVPNHSAGASGFGSTWSHAAKSQGSEKNSQENVIHSE